MSQDQATRESDVPYLPHTDEARIPDLRELTALFAPLSGKRERLARAYRILKQFRPKAPSYVFWHLGRFIHTIDRLTKVIRPGKRWFDISSDPWFCLLARKELGVDRELVATGYDAGTIDFEDESGDHYAYVAQRLRLSGDETAFAGAEEFDVVSSFEVIEHLQFHPAPFLTGCNNALRLGGQLVLTTPNVNSWSAISRLLDGDTPHMTGQYGGPMNHRKEYTLWEMQRVVEAAGFRIDKLTTFDGYLNDNPGLRTTALKLGTILCQAASLRPVRVRNLLLRGGSTMMLVATKLGPCDPAKVAAIDI